MREALRNRGTYLLAYSIGKKENYWPIGPFLLPALVPFAPRGERTFGAAARGITSHTQAIDRCFDAIAHS